MNFSDRPVDGVPAWTGLVRGPEGERVDGIDLAR